MQRVLVLLMLMTGCGSRPSGLTEPQVDEMLRIQQQVSSERSELGLQRDQLEDDRRRWDERERRDPIIANTIGAIGLLFACCLPLVLVILMVWSGRSEPESEAVCEILVDDLTSDTPKLINRDDPPRIERNE